MPKRWAHSYSLPKFNFKYDSIYYFQVWYSEGGGRQRTRVNRGRKHPHPRTIFFSYQKHVEHPRTCPTHSTISDKSRKTLRLPILPAPAFRLPNLPFSRELNLLFSKELHLPFSRELYLPSKGATTIQNWIHLTHQWTSFEFAAHSSLKQSAICNLIGRQLLRRWHAWARKQGEAIEKQIKFK